jgi:hypothetical protein
MNRIIFFFTVGCNQKQGSSQQGSPSTDSLGKKSRYQITEISDTKISVNGMERESSESIPLEVSVNSHAASLQIKSEAVRTRCELRIREIGYKPTQCGEQCLSVTVDVEENVSTVTLEFRRQVSFEVPVGDSASIKRTVVYESSNTPTWRTSDRIVHKNNPENITRMIDNQLDVFLNEFLKVNKKRIPGF